MSADSHERLRSSLARTVSLMEGIGIKRRALIDVMEIVLRDLREEPAVKPGIDYYCCDEMPKLIDHVAERFGVSQEDATNTLLIAVLACGDELNKARTITAQPLKLMVEAWASVDDATRPTQQRTKRRTRR